MADTNLRLILLASANSYRAESFVEAAKSLGIEVVKGYDVPAPLVNDSTCDLPLDYRDFDKSTRAIFAFAEKNPVRAVLSADDSATTRPRPPKPPVTSIACANFLPKRACPRRASNSTR